MYDLLGIWEKVEMLGFVSDCIDLWFDVVVVLIVFM